MKNIRVILLCGALSVAGWLPAAELSVTEQFQQALFAEEGTRDLEAAIEGYEAVIKRLDEQRQLAATAVFRLGETYRKLGRTNDAVAAYERVLSEFPDHETLATLSEQNLVVLRPNASELEELYRLSEQLGILKRQEQILTERFTPNHPRVSSLASEIQAIQRQIDELAVGSAKAAGTENGTTLSIESLLQQSPIEWAQLTSLEREILRATLSESLDSFASQSGVRTPEEALRRLQLLIPDPQLAQLEADTIAVNRKLARATAQYGPEHPEVKSLLAELDVLKQQAEQQIVAVIREREAKIRVLEHVSESAASAGGTITVDSTVPAITAKEAEELRSVMTLVANSPDLINKASDGAPPLHRAISNGHLNVVRFLLANGASTSRTDGNGRTPLYLAAREGHLSALGLLLDAGVDVNQPLPGNGRRAIHAATEFGNDAAIEFLLRKGADVNAEELMTGQTSLHIAASKGLTNAIAILIEGGADLELIADTERSTGVRIGGFKPVDAGTPLSFAVAREQESAVELLLANGANPNPENASTSPLFLAVQTFNTNLVQRLLAPGNVRTDEPLIGLALDTMPEVVPQLLDAGADPNGVDDNVGMPPLIFAAIRLQNVLQRQIDQPADGGDGTVRSSSMPTRRGTLTRVVTTTRQDSESDVDWEAIIKDMVGHGADINVVHRRQSVLSILASVGSKDPKAMQLINWVLENGANPNLGGGRSQGVFSHTPLNHACIEGDLELIKLLIQYGADLEGLEEDEAWTPLQLAANTENPDVVKLLLESGADPQAKYTDGQTPILYNVLRKYLIPGPASPLGNPFRATSSYFRNRSQLSQRDVQAKEHQILELTRIFLEHGAPLDTAWDEGFLPIHFAAAAEDPRFLKLFLEFDTNANTTTSTGITPLHVAANSGRTETIKLLHEAGADLNSQDENGNTPLHLAAIAKTVEATEALIELGANKEIQNHYGLTPEQTLRDGDPFVRTGPFRLPRYSTDPPEKRIENILSQ